MIKICKYMNLYLSITHFYHYVRVPKYMPTQLIPPKWGWGTDGEGLGVVNIMSILKLLLQNSTLLLLNIRLGLSLYPRAHGHGAYSILQIQYAKKSM